MQSLAVWGGILGSIFGVVTAAIGLIALYRSSVRKGYAAERDFAHLQRNYESLTRNIDTMAKDIDAEMANILKEIDARSDRIHENQLEIKALLLANLGVKPKHSE